MAHEVRPHHGITFVEGWIAYSSDGGALSDAVGETRLIEWPPERARGRRLRMTRAQRRYRDIEEEILRRTLDAVKGAIAAAFVRIASEVLDRERER